MLKRQSWVESGGVGWGWREEGKDQVCFCFWVQDFWRRKEKEVGFGGCLEGVGRGGKERKGVVCRWGLEWGSVDGFAEMVDGGCFVDRIV